MFSLSAFKANLAHSIGSGRSGNTKQAIKKYFKLKGLSLRPTSLAIWPEKQMQM
jgi:hypothetical protein